MAADGLNATPRFVRLFARGWRSWTPRVTLLAELSRLDSSESQRIANDVGVNGAELRAVAGKWPDSAELLSRRLPVLDLDEHKLREKEPQVLRDMQRVCTLQGMVIHARNDSIAGRTK
jgi:hypothetical protein